MKKNKSLSHLYKPESYDRSTEDESRMTSDSHSGFSSGNLWLSSSVPRPLKRKQVTNFSAFDFEPRTQR